jgi:hypothetical protein
MLINIINLKKFFTLSSRKIFMSGANKNLSGIQEEDILTGIIPLVL